MSWVSTASDQRSDVLGLHAETAARHAAFLDACTKVVDSQLLELCKARLAQELRCREELARHSPERLSELAVWYRSKSFSALERDALAFVDQFIVDPALIGHELVGRLEAELGTSGVIDFTAVIAAFEASFRLSTLLDLGPVR